MKISVLGAGNVSKSLGRSLVSRGHEVFFGVRNPKNENIQALLQEVGSNAQVGTNNEAIAFSKSQTIYQQYIYDG